MYKEMHESDNYCSRPLKRNKDFLILFLTYKKKILESGSRTDVDELKVIILCYMPTLSHVATSD